MRPQPLSSLSCQCSPLSRALLARFCLSLASLSWRPLLLLRARASPRCSVECHECGRLFFSLPRPTLFTPPPPHPSSSALLLATTLLLLFRLLLRLTLNLLLPLSGAASLSRAAAEFRENISISAGLGLGSRLGWQFYPRGISVHNIFIPPSRGYYYYHAVFTRSVGLNLEIEVTSKLTYWLNLIGLFGQINIFLNVSRQYLHYIYAEKSKINVIRINVLHNTP